MKTTFIGALVVGLFTVSCLKPLEASSGGLGEPGDILCRWGAFRGELGLSSTPFLHAAIDIGNGQVIEWSGGARRAPGGRRPLAEIRKSSKAHFVSECPRGTEPFIHPVITHRSPEEIVAWAYHYLENPHEVGHYDPILNNCQHLTMLCATGEKVSWQADPFNEALHQLHQECDCPITGILSGAYLIANGIAFRNPRTSASTERTVGQGVMAIFNSFEELLRDDE